MIKHYVNAVLNSFNFEGRMDRRAFWYFILSTMILSLIVFAADATPVIDALTTGKPLPALDQIGGAGKFLALLHTLPIFSAHVRRLHDTGRSFGSLLFGLIPIVGQVTLFAWLMEPSQHGASDRGTRSDCLKAPNWSDNALR